MAKKKTKQAADTKATQPSAKTLAAEVVQKLTLTKSYNLSRIFLFPLVVGVLACTVLTYRYIISHNTEKLLDPAVLSNSPEVTGLIRFGADINHISENGNTPLKIACKVSDVDVIESLLKYGAKVNTDPAHPSPLHAATEYRRADIIELLIARGANIDHTDAQHNTALSQAAYVGDPEIAQQLIRHGSAVDGIISDGAPLLVCVRRIIENLEEERKAKITAANNDPEDADEAAVPPAEGNPLESPPVEDPWKPDHVAVMDLLIQHGANVNIESEIGETPLILAASGNAAPLVEYFVEKGADINKESAIGSPCLLAAREKNWELVKLLIGKGASLDLSTHIGKNVLTDAVMAENLEFVKFLIINGAGADLVPNKKPSTDGLVSDKRVDEIIAALRLKFPRQLARMLKKNEPETATAPKVGDFTSGFRLNGIDEYAKVNEPNEDLAPKKTITVACWMKRRAIASQENKRLPFDQYIVSRNRGNKNGFNLYIDRDRRINWVVYDGTRAFTVKAEAKHLPANTWVHIAGTCGDGEIDLFVDGKPIGLASAGWIDCAKSGNTYIGRQAWAEGGYFAGEIQHLSVYTKRVYQNGFKPTRKPFLPDAAYFLLNHRRGKLSDQNNMQVYTFP